MAKYMVKMTIEQWVEAQDEDEALEEAKLNFDYSDLHYADVEIEENCECGLTEAGLWDESLFDKWGCECNTGDCDE